MAQDYAYVDSADSVSSDKAPLSVSAALAIVKKGLESLTFSIVGEVSDLSDNPRYKAVYFTLADKGAALSCLMWRNAFDPLGIELKSGMQIEVRGRFSLYSAKGRMQFDVKQLTLAGEGQLRAEVAALAAKLKAQGLMDASRKLPLPPVPETVGLITSPRGKAVHDVLRTLRRRFPLAKVLLFGTNVEGKDAAKGIIQALHAADASEAEVLLLVRGGGSYEDLMPFNDEALAVAIAELRTPLITGIGHEPDTAIADMVASLRASTPTAAAETAVPSAQDVASSLATRQSSLAQVEQRYLERARHILESYARSAVFTHSRSLTSEAALNLEQTALRLDLAIPTGFTAARESLKDAQQRMHSVVSDVLKDTHTTAQQSKQALGHLGANLVQSYCIEVKEQQHMLLHAGSTLTSASNSALATAAASIESLSPLAVLARGYALGYDEQGSILRSTAQVHEGSTIKVRLANGTIDAQVVSIETRGRQQ